MRRPIKTKGEVNGMEKGSSSDSPGDDCLRNIEKISKPAMNLVVRIIV